MHCPNCGAAVKEGNFCSYCGAKLTEDTKRIEVKIDKRIEDLAELKRVELEERESRIKLKQAEEEHKHEMAESKLRQRLMRKELHQGRGCFLKFLIGFLVLGAFAGFNQHVTASIILLAVATILVYISRR